MKTLTTTEAIDPLIAKLEQFANGTIDDPVILANAYQKIGRLASLHLAEPRSLLARRMRQIVKEIQTGNLGKDVLLVSEPGTSIKQIKRHWAVALLIFLALRSGKSHRTICKRLKVSLDTLNTYVRNAHDVFVAWGRSMRIHLVLKATKEYLRWTLQSMLKIAGDKLVYGRLRLPLTASEKFFFRLALKSKDLSVSKVVLKSKISAPNVMRSRFHTKYGHAPIDTVSFGDNYFVLLS